MEDPAQRARPGTKEPPINDPALHTLVLAARGGEKDAFRQIVEATHARVFQVAMRSVGSRHDADDVVQETFVRAWKRLDSLRDPAAVVGWLCRIARNVSMDVHRKRKRRRTSSLDKDAAEGVGPLIEAIADEGPIPSEALESAAMQAALAALIDEVKEKYRVVLLLREVDGMSYEEISVALGIPAGTVESRLHRGRKQLAEKIERLRARQAREVEDK